jgi:hypothetical protein
MQIKRLLTLVGFYAAAQAASLNGKTASQMEASTDATTDAELNMAVSSAGTLSNEIASVASEDPELELGARLPSADKIKSSSPDLACGLSSFSFPGFCGGNSCFNKCEVYKPKYLISLPDDFTINLSFTTATTPVPVSTNYTVPNDPNNTLYPNGFFNLPTSFRYVTHISKPTNTTPPNCTYNVIWQDGVNPLLRTTIF